MVTKLWEEMDEELKYNILRTSYENGKINEVYTDYWTAEQPDSRQICLDLTIDCKIDDEYNEVVDHEAHASVNLTVEEAKIVVRNLQKIIEQVEEKFGKMKKE